MTPDQAGGVWYAKIRKIRILKPVAKKSSLEMTVFADNCSLGKSLIVVLGRAKFGIATSDTTIV